MISPAEETGFSNALIQKWLYEMRCHIPAIVDAVNDDDTVNLQFAIDEPYIIRNNETLEMPERNTIPTIYHENVPVKILSSGNFKINIPIEKGCKGYVYHSDLDHDNFFLGNFNANGTTTPHTARSHDFTDIVFEPAFNGNEITGDCLELVSKNVTMKICDDGFDVIYNGQSLMSILNTATYGKLTSWIP